MDSGFKRLWARRKSKDKRSSSSLDNRQDSYPPNIPFNRATSAAANRYDDPLPPVLAPIPSSNLPTYYETQLLAGSFSRPGTAGSTRPETSGSLTNAVLQAADSVDRGSNVYTRRASISTQKLNTPLHKTVKSIDIFAVAGIQQPSLPRPSFNEDVAERNRDGNRSQLYGSPPSSPLIPGVIYSEDVAERNISAPRFTNVRSQSRLSSAKYQEDVASRNAPPPLEIKKSMDISSTKEQAIETSKSFYRPQSGTTWSQTTSQDRNTISGDGASIRSSKGDYAVSRASNYQQDPRSRTSTSIGRQNVLYFTPTPSASIVQVSTSPFRNGESWYNPSSPKQNSPAGDDRSLPSTADQEPNFAHNLHASPKSAYQSQGDLNKGKQSAQNTPVLQGYTHVSTTSSSSSRPYLLPSDTQAKYSSERQNVRIAPAKVSTPSRRPEYGSMRSNSATSNTSSLKKSIALPPRAIVDFTAKDSDVYSQQSDYGWDGTPVIEMAEADVMQHVSPAVVYASSPLESGVKLLPSPITEEPLTIGSKSSLLTPTQASFLDASRYPPPGGQLAPPHTSSIISFSPINTLASLPPGALRPPKFNILQHSAIMTVDDSTPSATPSRAASVRQVFGPLRAGPDAPQILVASPKLAQTPKGKSRVDLTSGSPPFMGHASPISPSAPIVVASRAASRMDLTGTPGSTKSPDVRIDMTEMDSPIDQPTSPDTPEQTAPLNIRKVTRQPSKHIADQIAALTAKSPGVSPVINVSKVRPPEPGIQTRDFANFDGTYAQANGVTAALTEPVIQLPERHPSRPKIVNRSVSGDSAPLSLNIQRVRSQETSKPVENASITETPKPVEAPPSVKQDDLRSMGRLETEDVKQADVRPRREPSPRKGAVRALSEQGGKKTGVRSKSRDNVKKRKTPKIEIYSSKFDEAGFARKQAEAKAALIRLQESLNETHVPKETTIQTQQNAEEGKVGEKASREIRDVTETPEKKPMSASQLAKFEARHYETRLPTGMLERNQAAQPQTVQSDIRPYETNLNSKETPTTSNPAGDRGSSARSTPLVSNDAENGLLDAMVALYEQGSSVRQSVEVKPTKPDQSPNIGRGIENRPARIQQILTQGRTPDDRPGRGQPTNPRIMPMPIAPRPNSVGIHIPPSAKRSDSTQSSPVNQSRSPPTSFMSSFHDIVTQGQPGKGKERACPTSEILTIPQMTDQFLDSALYPPQAGFMSESNGMPPPSPGEVSLSSFPIPVSSPRTSKGSGEMKIASPPNIGGGGAPLGLTGLVRTHSLKSVTPSVRSSASIFSIPVSMIPDRSSSMRDMMVKLEEEKNS